VRDLLRQNARFFLMASAAALGLRFLFLARFPSVTADSLLYGEIARNWLQHGIYGISDGGRIEPTCMRLPGYPAALAAFSVIFGSHLYRGVLVAQILVDLGTCFLVADLARRLVSPRAAKAAFLLAGLCPFLANYAAAALTETLEIFFTALALDFAVIGLSTLADGKLRPWVGCGLAVGATILLRPDGGLLLIAIELYLFARTIRLWFEDGAGTKPRNVLTAGIVVGILSLAPLVPWTLRNLHTLHQFQPLAPRYANEENEFVPVGFNRWVKTWMAEYVSVEEIYWPVPGDPIDARLLPARAFDSAEQRAETEQLFADYNRALHFTPALDARFAALAAERIHAAPMRYYLLLPLLRITDMWLRPRTELLPSDTRWWEFNDDPRWSVLAVALGMVGLGYVLAAAAGLLRLQITGPLILLLTFVVLRSVFLGTLENPEPRYTLECYPVVLLFASALFR
jgi:4-amino-4-deoxy-L-arabinose transferase-like glycosyltransferase